MKKYSIPVYPILLTLFIFLNCVFYRDFAYISVGPYLYITEIFLFITCVFFAIRSLKLIWAKDFSCPPVYLVCSLFFLWGFSILIIPDGADIFFKLREFASIYYSLLFVAAAGALITARQVPIIVNSILCASFLSMLLIIGRYILGLGSITTTDLVYRYGNYEIVGIFFLYTYFLCRYMAVEGSAILNLAGIALCLFVVNFLIAHRSGSLAMMASTLIVVCLSSVRKNEIKNLIKLALAVVVGLAFLQAILPEFTGSAISRIQGIFEKSIYEDPNASWRLVVWSHVISDMSFLEYLYGVGWGYEVKPLYFSDRDYAIDGRIGIHNSVIFYFFHTGAVGVFLFFALLIMVYRRSVKAVRKLQPCAHRREIITLLAGNVGIIFFSLFNVVLEGPYMAVVFWITLGLLYNYSSSIIKFNPSVTPSRGVTARDSCVSYRSS